MKDRKFAFYTYTNPATGDIKSGDMPYKDWERIQRDRNRKPHFKLDRVVDLDDPSKEQVPVADAGKVISVPVEEDPLECPLCGYVAVDERELKMHRAAKHD